jgi:hypothetical protein
VFSRKLGRIFCGRDLLSFGNAAGKEILKFHRGVT